MNARELYLLSVKENGIPSNQYAKLSRKEKMALEERNGKYWLTPQERGKFRVVLTGGVFDILHIGHILTLQKAKEHGDILIVVVTTDARVEEMKKRKPVHPADYRRAMVASLKPVDLAIVGCANMMETFARVSPDTVAFGYDQTPMQLPSGCKSIHLKEVKADNALAKTSRVIERLGL